MSDNGGEGADPLATQSTQPVSPPGSPLASPQAGSESEDSDFLVRRKKDKKKKEKKDKKGKKEKKEKRAKSPKESPKRSRKSRRSPERDEEEEPKQKKAKVEQELMCYAKSYVPEPKDEEDASIIEKVRGVDLVLTSLRNGMPGRFLTTEESLRFAPRSDVDKKKFLFTRNVTLKLWEEQPLRRLYLSTLRNRVQNPSLGNTHAVFSFLEEIGAINYGLTYHKYMTPLNGNSVCIIGAGVAGLLTAHQLIREGFEVTLFEAAEEVGGRCGDIVLKKDGEEKGIRVPRGPTNRYLATEMLIAKDVPDNITDDAISMRSQQGELIGLEQSLDQLSTAPSREASQANSQDSQEGGEDPKEVPLNTVQLHTILKQTGVEDSWWADAKSLPLFFAADGNHIVLNAELLSSLERSEAELKSFVRASTTNSRGDENKAAAEKYMQDKPTLRHAFSKYEMDSHATLDQLASSAVDRSIPFNTHRLPTTWGEVCEKLSIGLNIKKGRFVRHIDHSNEANVTITTYPVARDLSVDYTGESAKEEHTFDHCVVTAPIGVLQAVEEDKENEPVSNKRKRDEEKDKDKEKEKEPTYFMQFTPKLPVTKRHAIDSIGAGVRNTLILQFDDAFWAASSVLPTAEKEDEQADEIDDLDAEPKALPTDPNAKERSWDLVLQSGDAEEDLRGVGVTCQLEGGDIPHAIFSLSGEAAKLAEDGRSDELTEWVMKALRRIFSDISVPEPFSTLNSKWGSRKFTRCSAPFATHSTAPVHFSDLGAPLETSNVFFAGDATDPEHYGRLEGAVNSATRVSREVVARNKKLIQERKIARKAVTSEDRMIRLKMTGAPLSIDKVIVDSKHKADTKKQENAMQLSRGSSRNLAEKYRKIEAVPTLQRNLFNAKIKASTDNLDKGGFVNREVTMARYQGQVGLRHLEKQTEARWLESRMQKERELAKAVVSEASKREEEHILKKRKVQVTAATVKSYKAGNAVDDLLPTWYYQSQAGEGHAKKEFVSAFYTGARQRIDNAKKAEEAAYRRKLEEVIADVLSAYAVPDLALELGNDIRFYSKVTLRRELARLVDQVVKKFCASLERTSSKPFNGEWSKLPDPASEDVGAGIRRTVKRMTDVFEDPQKEKVIAQLGYDPAERVALRRRVKQEDALRAMKTEPKTEPKAELPDGSSIAGSMKFDFALPVKKEQIDTRSSMTGGTLAASVSSRGSKENPPSFHEGVPAFTVKQETPIDVNDNTTDVMSVIKEESGVAGATAGATAGTSAGPEESGGFADATSPAFGNDTPADVESHQVGETPMTSNTPMTSHQPTPGGQTTPSIAQGEYTSVPFDEKYSAQSEVYTPDVKPADTHQ